MGDDLEFDLTADPLMKGAMALGFKNWHCLALRYDSHLVIF